MEVTRTALLAIHVAPLSMDNETTMRTPLQFV